MCESNWFGIDERTIIDLSTFVIYALAKGSLDLWYLEGWPGPNGEPLKIAHFDNEEQARAVFSELKKALK